MSEYTGVVTTRDVLEWAIVQGVFSEDGIQGGNPHRNVIGDVDGPWREILFALVQCVAEGLAHPAMLEGEHAGLEGFEQYIENHCLQNLTRVFNLSDRQVGVVRSLAQEFRLFFDASVLHISPAGLDGPVAGDLEYHCGFDFNIEIPEWVPVQDV